MPTITRTAAALTVVVAAVTLLSGCRVEIGGGTPSATSTQAQDVVPRRQIEQVTAQRIREQSGGGPIVIECPGDLPIEEGAEQQCVLGQDGKRFTLTVSITNADSPSGPEVDWKVGELISQTG